MNINTKLKPGVDAVAQAFLDVTLQRLNILDAEFAARCDWTRHAFMSQRTAGFPCRPLRWRIEFELGFVPIWSSGSEVDLRRQCVKSYGIDPRIAALPDLKELCRRLGVASPYIQLQEEWYSNLIAWLAVHQSKNRVNTETEKVKV